MTPTKDNANSKRPPRARRWVLGVLALAVLSSTTLRLLRAQQAPEDETLVEDTRMILEKWVQTKRLIAEEKRDLALDEQLLNDRIEVLQGRINTIGRKTQEARGKISEIEKKREQLNREHQALVEAADSLDPVLLDVESGVRELLTRMPPFVLSDPQIEKFAEMIPEDPKETKLSLSERFQSVVVVLNRLTKLNQEIRETSEVRELPDGSTMAVDVLYLGITYAYYVDANATVAGVGMATPEGWVWKHDNSIAKQVRLAVKIYDNEEEAVFVQLPVNVQESGKQP
jgi:hypothetical protein